MKIQLLYFAGCPNLDPARAALRDAMRAEQIDQAIEEVDLESPAAPASLRGWGSPTILIDGEEITGAARTTGAACRLYAHGAPSVEEIRARLAASRRPPAGSSVELRDDAVVVSDPDSKPSVRTLTLAEAWAGSGRMLFVREPDRLV